jgi:hypothetical protein
VSSVPPPSTSKKSLNTPSPNLSVSKAPGSAQRVDGAAADGATHTTIKDDEDSTCTNLHVYLQINRVCVQ